MTELQSQQAAKGPYWPFVFLSSKQTTQQFMNTPSPKLGSSYLSHPCAFTCSIWNQCQARLLPNRKHWTTLKTVLAYKPVVSATEAVPGQSCHLSGWWLCWTSRRCMKVGCAAATIWVASGARAGDGSSSSATERGETGPRGFSAGAAINYRGLECKCLCGGSDKGEQCLAGGVGRCWVVRT